MDNEEIIKTVKRYGLDGIKERRTNWNFTAGCSTLFDVSGWVAIVWGPKITKKRAKREKNEWLNEVHRFFYNTPSKERLPDQLYSSRNSTSGKLEEIAFFSGFFLSLRGRGRNRYEKKSRSIARLEFLLSKQWTYSSIESKDTYKKKRRRELGLQALKHKKKIEIHCRLCSLSQRPSPSIFSCRVLPSSLSCQACFLS